MITRIAGLLPIGLFAVLVTFGGPSPAVGEDKGETLPKPGAQRKALLAKRRIPDPPRQKPVEITARSFRELEKRGLLPVTNLQQEVAGQREWRASDKALRDVLKEQLGNDPERVARYMARPVVEEETSGKTEGGRYVVDLVTRDGREESVALLGTSFAQRTLSETLVEIGNPKSAEQSYSALYRGIQRAFAEDAAASESYLDGFPDPGTVGEAAAAALADLVARWKKDPPESLPAVPEGKNCAAACEKDVPQRALVGGEKALACYAKSKTGLWATSDWTLKSASTCVKDQGQTRGTSIAFAISAAVEAALRLAHGMCSDLSEQHLHYQQKNRWFVLPPNFGDDMNAPAAVLGRMVDEYAFRNETAWNYNLSPKRTEVRYRTKNGPTVQYANSCMQYLDRPCSETDHQGQYVCEKDGDRCGYIAQIKPSKAGIEVTSFATFFDVTNPSETIDLAPLFLSLGMPVVTAFQIPQSFLDASDDGFISVVKPGANDPLRGWHVALVEGWVRDARAAGGGYFVVKGSWGPCVGDAGYWYVPKRWMEEHALSMTAVTGVEARTR